MVCGCVAGAGTMSVGGYDGKIAGLYDLEETLGRGHYAVVKLARHVFTGEKVAVKVTNSARHLSLVPHTPCLPTLPPIAFFLTATVTNTITSIHLFPVFFFSHLL